VTIQATVLHPGYIMQEFQRAVGSSRYRELSAALIAWHELPGHDCDEPPAEVAHILAELKAMKLRAFTYAGMQYRMALDEYEKRADYERTLRDAGFGAFVRAGHGDPLPGRAARADHSGLRLPGLRWNVSERIGTLRNAVQHLCNTSATH
jgi:hypothetical protein